jgi:DNA-binding MarR family transcriptional regulator
MALVTDLHLARLLLRALRAVQATYIERLQQRGHTGVRTGHIPVFAGLDPGGTRITDLATRAGMTRQMMGRLVRELVDLGYLAADPDPHDQRAVIVTITERGRTFGTEAGAVIAELEREYADLLDDPNLVALKTGLATISNTASANTASANTASAGTSPTA